jgi:hypothetical protein
MNEQRRSDTELAAALQSWLPQSAPSGSADRLATALRTTGQRRSLPFPIAPLVDADPAGRQWALVVAATLLLATALAGAVAAGALKLWSNSHLAEVPPSQAPSPAPSLAPSPSLDLPSDPQAYMVSVVQDSPLLRPMAFTAMADAHPTASGDWVHDPVKTRVYMDGAGNVRVEYFASVGSGEPLSYSITTADRRVELRQREDGPVWVEDGGPQDPRDRLFIETAAYIGVPDERCDMTAPERAVGWQYIGLEQVLGRPAHHLRCLGDWWIDAETRLVLRSRGVLTDDGQPADSSTHTVEVTELDLGPQPDRLFDTTTPAGLRVVTPADQDAWEDEHRAAAACAADPVCSAPDVPLVTPAPVAGARKADDADAIVARALAARDAQRPLHITVDRWRSRGGDAGQERLDFLAPDRYRVDWGPDPVAGTPARTGIFAGEEIYESTSDVDGAETWHRRTWNRFKFYPSDWLVGTLLVPEPGECGSGWRHLGVDRVGPFTADHVACQTDEAWVDRDTGLVVRTQSGPTVDAPWISVREVVALTFGPTPDDRFHPPVGAAVESEPPPATPDPNFIPTAPPQKVGG